MPLDGKGAILKTSFCDLSCHKFFCSQYLAGRVSNPLEQNQEMCMNT